MFEESTDGRDFNVIWIAQHCKPLHISQCKAIISKQNNRKPLSTDLEARIEKHWKKRVTENPTLFNGRKFRFNNVSFDQGNFLMNLGITSYKDFIGTNMSPDSKDIGEYGHIHLKDHQACFSDALGVGGFVKTTDNFMILIKRSFQCAEAAGVWDRPGGHPEPENCFHMDIKMDDICTEVVVKEFYEAVIQEIVNEVNISKNTLSEPLLMGIARNPHLNGKPSAEFFLRCSLNSKEILQKYKKGTQIEADESTNITFVPIDCLGFSDNKHSYNILQNLAPAAKASIFINMKVECDLSEH